MKSVIFCIRASIILVLLQFFLLNSTVIQAQGTYRDIDTAQYYLKFKVKVDPDNFKQDLFKEIMLFEVSKHREFRHELEPLINDTILEKAALHQATFMTEIEKESLLGSGKLKTTGSRVKYFGGSDKAIEIVKKINLKKGPEYLTYKKIVDETIFKWFDNKKTLAIISDPKYIFAGTSALPDNTGKKLYISLVFGNYQSHNTGADLRDDLKIPFTNKKYGLKPFDEKECRRCNKFKNIEDLQKALNVENGIIYFKYDNLKNFKKLIKKPKDGIAVDIILKDQYSCGRTNIIDNNLPNKGVMTKRLWTKKIYKKNMITNKRLKQIVFPVGELPAGLAENDYELNLIIIQNKRVCRNLPKTHITEADIEYSDVLDLLADTLTIVETEYKPSATTATLYFKIPFEAAKSEYKQEDIEPFLDAMNEPDFTITELDITAFSSIEGTDETNKSLQKRRAESIVNSLKSRQKSDIKTNITKSYNIDEFKRDIYATPYSDLASMSISEVQDYIRTNKLNKKLEPYLQNHRYAKITLNIKYEIDGDKEQAYVLKMFNLAITENKLPLALSIQKYIFKKLLADEYDENAVYEQNIPDKPEYAGMNMNKLWLSGLLMNKLWLENYISDSEISDEFCENVHNLNSLSPDNVYISYNSLYCDILHNELGNDKNIDEVQKEIEAFYESTLSKKTIDALNLNYQFKIIENLDTLDTPHPKMFESLERIKEIVNLKESNWQNSLKLSYIFIGQEDYNFAIRLIEPFTENEIVFEELLFAYISLCTYFPHRISSNKFVQAMTRVSNDYPDRFCNLFKDNKLSIQIFENPEIKELYCKQCNK